MPLLSLSQAHPSLQDISRLACLVQVIPLLVTQRSAVSILQIGTNDQAVQGLRLDSLKGEALALSCLPATDSMPGGPSTYIN
jgi:hypothetical protein